MPPFAAGVSSGVSVEGAEEDAVPANRRLWTVVEDPSRGDAPVEEVSPSATLVEEGSGMDMPDLLPEVETQAAPSPHHADASSAGRTNKEMVQEELLSREVVAAA
jgi:hypothetical protein